MRIIYEDEYIIVCHKEAGELSEGDTEGCLPYILSRHLEDNGERRSAVFVVHRLDRETEGVIVYAKDSRSAAALSEDIREGRFSKQYFALCHGELEEKQGTMNDLLYYDRRKGKSFVVDRKRTGVKDAALEYEVLSFDGSCSLVRIKLLTGRTHQIRVQFASRKHPLLGDRRYGAPKDGYTGIALLSHSIEFKHPKTKKVISFVADESKFKA